MPASRITPALLAAADTYAAYRRRIDHLLAQGRSTGPRQSEALTHYTRLNVQRMQRLDKTVQVQPALQAAAAGLAKEYTWLVLTEGWCGDAAQLVPVLEAVARASAGRLHARYLLRDEHPALMDEHLTRGGRAIPRLLVLDAATRAVVATWGPRPAPAQALHWELKAQGRPPEETATALHTWYARDRTRTTQAELLALLHRLAAGRE